MPDDDARYRRRSGAGYTVEMAVETMDLCAIAKLPVRRRQGLRRRQDADRGGAHRAGGARRFRRRCAAVDGTAQPAGQAEANVAAAWDDVVAKQNAEAAEDRHPAAKTPISRRPSDDGADRCHLTKAVVMHSTGH
jgi:hypothetical protein